MRRLLPLLCAPLLLITGACSAHLTSAIAQPASAATLHRAHVLKKNNASVLQHIVVIIQENRSVDNLFNGFCVNGTICANTVTVDPVTGTPLISKSLADAYGPDHSHGQFVTEFDNGLMDGFSKASGGCKGSCNGKTTPTVFAYVPSSETGVYQQMATVDGVLSDDTFQTNSGPSFPAHMYAIAGQSGGYDDDHEAIVGGSGTCGQIKKVQQLDMTTPYPGSIAKNGTSCKDFETIFDLVANAGKTWRYYSNGTASFFSTTQSIQHLYNSPNFIPNSRQFASDVAAGNLANVTFVMPYSEKVSDHPETVKKACAGPNWVASLVNAVGNSQFWNNTAIIIWWDDWGGWYDHVSPPTGPGPSWLGHPNPYEDAFRVPLLVLSPYATIGTIDHNPRTFVSALNLIEEAYGLPSLGTTDQFEPGLDSMFNFNQSPAPFTPIGSCPSAAPPFKRMR